MILWWSYQVQETHTISECPAWLTFLLADLVPSQKSGEDTYLSRLFSLLPSETAARPFIVS